MRTDVVKMYKDVHAWVGIVSGLALFIAFYAGAITMFEQPLQRWASAPSSLPAAPSLADTPALIEAALAAHPEAAKGYTVHLRTGSEAPARLTWAAGPPAGEHEAPAQVGASLSPQGDLVVEPLSPSPVAQFVDVLHQQVGLPFAHEVAMPIMGAIALLYAVALISGIVVIIPSLAKDLFALRIGKNLKRMWLDVHNALGVFSLPFHLVMCLTAVVFAFHDQFYDTQNALLYDRGLEAIWAKDRPAPARPAPGQAVLPPTMLVERLKAEAPSFVATQIGYRAGPGGVMSARIEGFDDRYAMRGPTFGFVAVDPYTGAPVQKSYLPGHQDGWMSTVTGAFSLHFGSFGGQPVRWGYFALGLAGAFLFYSGNLLWIETRRKRMTRKAGEVPQSLSTRIMGALTVGVSLGCVAGVSLTIAAAKWLPERVEDLEAWHGALYYAAFLAAVAWALLRGAARGGIELLYACAAATALIPLSTLVAGAWSWPDATRIVDAVAVVGAAGFVVLARLALRRARNGPRDSIWSVGAVAAQAPAPAE